VPELETPAEFRARMQSIGLIKGGRKRDKVRTVTRPHDGGLDAGRRAKQTTDENGSVITESDNRQDVNIVPPTHYETISFMGGEG
jgi:hypothetical protein